MSQSSPIFPNAVLPAPFEFVLARAQLALGSNSLGAGNNSSSAFLIARLKSDRSANLKGQDPDAQPRDKRTVATKELEVGMLQIDLAVYLLKDLPTSCQQTG